MSDHLNGLTTHPGERSRSGDTVAGLLKSAKAGDRAAFGRLVERYHREMLTHCYRMLGSLQEAEEMVQETFLRAWRRLETYEGRASFRAWLYRIATNACLDSLAKRPKRTLPSARHPASDPGEGISAPILEPIWLEPFPDDLLAPTETTPEARYESRESITLAFLFALQHLPARQRAMLILRDVLDWQAREVAELLDTTVSAVNSGLYRARTTLSSRYRGRRREVDGLKRADQATRALLDRYVRVWQEADIDGLVALLKEDATFPMPPLPSWYQGRAAIRAFVEATILAGEARGRWRLVPVRANGRPGFAWYQRDESQNRYHAYAIQVLTYDGDLLEDVTTFGMPPLFPLFGLPMELTG